MFMWYVFEMGEHVRLVDAVEQVCDLVGRVVHVRLVTIDRLNPEVHAMIVGHTGGLL